MEYLGVIVSHDSVKMDHVKVAGVTEWPIPTNKKEVQLFLGFTNFYRRFIEGFSHVARPLFDLTKVDSTFHWSMEEQLAFDTLWERITSAPITPDHIVLKWIALTSQQEQSCLKSAWKTENGTLSHSCLNLCLPLKGIMRYMIRKCWPLSEPWKNDDTS